MNSLRCLLLVLVAGTASAQTPQVQLESRVTGTRELPKVTYILPWRQPAEVAFDWTPEPGIAGELFQPLRRDEYRRQLQYKQSREQSLVQTAQDNAPQ